MPVLDTSREAAHAQAMAYRRMGPSRRFRSACEMSETFRRVAVDRIRREHPEYTEVECRNQLIWELYGIRRER